MALSTPVRIALGLGIAGLAIAGFAAASGQLSPTKANAGPTSLTNQITNQVDDKGDDQDDDDRDDRQENRTETRVIDAKTGQVVTEDIRRNEYRSRDERDEDESHDRDDDHGGRDHD